MSYRHYSVPRLVRSSSLDRGSRAVTLARDLYDDYNDVKVRSRRNDSVVMDRFGRALSEMGRDYPTRQIITRRPRLSIIQDGPLPSSNLRASAPYYERGFLPLHRAASMDNLVYMDESPMYTEPIQRVLPMMYRDYSPYVRRNEYEYVPYRAQYYPSLNYNYGYSYGHTPNYYRPSVYSAPIIRPSYRDYYPIYRYPSVPQYYRYQVLPHYGYNASDYRRYHRRGIASRVSNSEKFIVPPPRFYSTLRQDLRGILDKMDSHRTLIDRYATIDMKPRSQSVEQSIMEKSMQFSRHR